MATIADKQIAIFIHYGNFGLALFAGGIAVVGLGIALAIAYFAYPNYSLGFEAGIVLGLGVSGILAGIKLYLDSFRNLASVKPDK